MTRFESTKHRMDEKSVNCVGISFIFTTFKAAFFIQNELDILNNKRKLIQKEIFFYLKSSFK